MEMKELLESLVNGDKTIDEVVEALEKDQKNMVPRSRLNDKNNEIKDLKQQLDDRDTQLKDLSTKATGNEELQKQIQDLQAANDQAKQEYEAKLSQQTYDFTLDRALMSAKARNPKAVKALLDMESIKLDGESLLGLNEQLDALKESDSYLFASEEQQQGGSGGYNPGSDQKTNPPPGSGEKGYNDAREQVRALLKRK
jgi:DNA repair exonuclease SbcCD ATPase subunit